MEKNKKALLTKDVIRTYLPLAALIVVIILFAVLSNGRTMRINNISQIMLQASTYIIAGLGIIFTMSLGNMDMSLDGIICLAGALGVLASEYSQSWLMFPVIFGVAVLCQMVIGSLNILLSVNSVIVSFAVSFFGKGVAGYIIGNRTKGLSVPGSFSEIYSKTTYYIVALIAIVVIVLVFHYTKVGKRAMAIGSNVSAARAAGINVTKHKLIAYLIAGLMMGLATLMIVLRAGSAGRHQDRDFM